MNLNPALHRRTLLRGGAAALALGALAPAAVQAAVAETARAGVFGFGVASGDPTATEVLLWTRVTPTPNAVPGSSRGPSSKVVWEVAADEAFTEVLRAGTNRTDADRTTPSRSWSAT